MVKLKHGTPTTGPSSSLGIMRFFDADTAGPKISPEAIVVISAIFIIAVLIIKNFT